MTVKPVYESPNDVLDKLILATSVGAQMTHKAALGILEEKPPVKTLDDFLEALDRRMMLPVALCAPQVLMCFAVYSFWLPKLLALALPVSIYWLRADARKRIIVSYCSSKIHDDR